MAELNGKKILFSPHIHMSGGGTEYTEGTGIDITDGVISLDSDTQTEIAKIAGKQDTLPVYILQYDGEETYKVENLAILRAIKSAATSVGSYLLYLKVGNIYLEPTTFVKGSPPVVSALDASDPTDIKLYSISGSTSGNYSETVTTIFSSNT